MATKKTALGVIATFAVLAIGALIYTIIDVRTAMTTLAASGKRLESLRAKQSQLQRQITEQTERAAAVEADNAKLQKAMHGVQTAIAVPQPGSAAHKELLMARLQRVGAALSDGYLDAALKECLRCYDESTEGMPILANIRWAALGYMAQIAEKYPPALAALRARRDRAEQEMLAAPDEKAAIRVIVHVNTTLGDNSRNRALFDQLPADDSRRQGFLFNPEGNAIPGMVAGLISDRRYADVLAICSYQRMDAQLERNTWGEKVFPNLVRWHAQFIEALAGTGQLEQARIQAGKLLDYDGAQKTRALLQKHLERAGQPDLLATLPK